MPAVASDSAIDPIDVVGIGAGGWAGLADESRAALAAAQVVVGGARQLDLLNTGEADQHGGLHDVRGAQRVALPSPLQPGLIELLEAQRGRRTAVLASGDPMFFGIGSTLVRLLGPHRLRVYPHPSSVSLAAARLGWPLEETDVLSAVGRPLAALAARLAPGRRLLVLTTGPDGGARVRDLLATRGYRDSELTVLSRLGGPDEHIGPVCGAGHDPLAVVAVRCGTNPRPLSCAAALPDEAFEHDGQLTKREIRAVTLSSLVPLGGQLLWDVGAGSGSVGIEWMRTHPACRAYAIEPRADRRERIARNAETLGVPALEVVDGHAPAVLANLPAPEAVFVGGGLSTPGVIQTCRQRLRSGGRLVANAVTLSAETTLAEAYQRLGGTLTRLHVERAAPVGGFTGWRPAMPITQWVWRKESL